MPPTASSMPLDLILIHLQRFILRTPSMPDPRTRSSPIIRMIHITCSDRIQVSVLYPLPKQSQKRALLVAFDTSTDPTSKSGERKFATLIKRAEV